MNGCHQAALDAPLVIQDLGNKLGEFPVGVHLHTEVDAEILVRVVADE